MEQTLPELLRLASEARAGMDSWVGSGLHLSQVSALTSYKAVPTVCFSSVLLLAQVDILSCLFEVRNVMRLLWRVFRTRTQLGT